MVQLPGKHKHDQRLDRGAGASRQRLRPGRLDGTPPGIWNSPFTPGLHLPTHVVAGLLKTRFRTFALCRRGKNPGWATERRCEYRASYAEMRVQTYAH